MTACTERHRLGLSPPVTLLNVPNAITAVKVVWLVSAAKLPAGLPHAQP
jgi:hypothetical protein